MSSYGYIDIVVNGFNDSYFSNSVQNNIIIYTDNNTQSILIGPTTPNYTLAISNGYITINSNVSLNVSNNNLINNNIIFPAGVILPYPKIITSVNIPSGWFLCDGSSKNISQYPELFKAIHYIYGTGVSNDGSTFNLPLLDGNYIKGMSSTSPLSNTSLGASSVTLSTNNIGSHTHLFQTNVTLSESVHTHPYQTNTVASSTTAAHSHQISANTNAVDPGSHSHPVSINTTAGGGTHNHSIASVEFGHAHNYTKYNEHGSQNNATGNQTNFYEDTPLNTGNNTTTGSANADPLSGGTHSHNFTGVTSGAVDLSHQHVITADIIEAEQQLPVHTHSAYTQLTDVNIAVTNINSGNAQIQTVPHTHTFNATTQQAGGTNTSVQPITIIPAAHVFSFLIKF